MRSPRPSRSASARAASFGGSCVYLEQGEQMSVSDMLKCIAVVSANDCAVAMAEHLCGSEEAFTARMNRRQHGAAISVIVYVHQKGKKDMPSRCCTTCCHTAKALA